MGTEGIEPSSSGISKFLLTGARNSAFELCSHKLNIKKNLEGINIQDIINKVNIKKGDDRNEMLIFSELFDFNWVAIYSDGTIIPNEKHYLVNTYANGWILDRNGDYSITLQFKPQNFLNLGKQISAISIFAGIMYLGFAKWRKIDH